MDASAASPTLVHALERLQRADIEGARSAVAAAAEQAEARYGTLSPPHVNALNDLATLLFQASDWEGALAALRHAASAPLPSASDALSDRLAVQTNLGELLTLQRQWAEAEAALRLGLEGRATLYGRQHPSYAMGLEPLARLYLQSGQLGAALETIEETLSLYWQHNHGRAIPTLVLRAEIINAIDPTAFAFADLNGLPDSLIIELAQMVFFQQSQGDMAVMSEVLSDLCQLLIERLGEDHDTTLRAYTQLANLETLRPSGDAARRRWAIGQALAAFKRLQRWPEAVHALMGLALAQEEGEAVIASYEEAAAHAEELGDEALLAEVLRNYGLWLQRQPEQGAEFSPTARAEGMLRRAVACALACGQSTAIGSSHLALGILLQRQGRFDEAKTTLETGIRHLDAHHPDMAAAQRHLAALKRGQRSSDPQSLDPAVADACRRWVLAQLPKDLVVDFQLTPNGDGKPQVSVKLKRKPSPQESEQLQRLIAEAVATFGQRLGG